MEGGDKPWKCWSKENYCVYIISDKRDAEAKNITCHKEGHHIDKGFNSSRGHKHPKSLSNNRVSKYMKKKWIKGEMDKSTIITW